MVFRPSTFKACVAPGCIESADDNPDGWEVAGINAVGKVEYWCAACSMTVLAKHITLDKARAERQAALSRLSRELIEQQKDAKPVNHTAAEKPPRQQAAGEDSDSDAFVPEIRGGKIGVRDQGRNDDDSDSDSLPPARPLKPITDQQVGSNRKATAAQPGSEDDDSDLDIPMRSSLIQVNNLALSKKSVPPQDKEDSDDDDDFPPPRHLAAKQAKQVVLPAGQAPLATGPEKGKMIQSDEDDSDDDDLPPPRSSHRPMQPARQDKKGPTASLAGGKKAALVEDSDSD